MLHRGIALLLFVCASVSSHVHGRADIVRVVLVDDGDLAPLMDRLEGQLSDVEVDLAVAPASEATALPHDVLLRVEGTGRLDAPEPYLVVVVAVPAHGAILRQEIRPSRGRARRSALLEQAAMFVRTTLLALAEGGRLGVSPSLAAEPPPPDARATEPSPTPEPPASPPSEVQPAIALGVFGAIDGQTAWGQRGVDVSVDLAIDIVRVGARLAFGLPSESEDERTRLHLWHHGLDAYGMIEAQPTEGLRLGVGASVGVALIHRSTEVLRPGLAPTPPEWNAALRFGPRLSARWRPSGGRLELAVSFVLDIVPSPVTFAYEQADGTAQRALWPVQPRLGLALRMLP